MPNSDALASAQAGDRARPTDIRDIETTTCVVVGGGPAGAVLSLMLARNGIQAVLLEEHGDFDRQFRGDTIHPSAMQLMDELGLADRLLQQRHTQLRTIEVEGAGGTFQMANFGRLKTRFPYVTIMPQTEFLQFITGEARRYPGFKLVMGARVDELVTDGGIVRGVRYQGVDGRHEVRALLTVGADGRFSRIRHLANLVPITTSPPMDVLWFRLPRRPDDPEDALGRFGSGHILALIDRFDFWQAGYVIPKGGYQKLRTAGLPALRKAIAQLAPQMADRVDTLQDWKQVSLLSVESSRLPQWHRAGLLLIGDAAHVMSPVGGVGINYAIQDAVVAANLLSEPLKTGGLNLADLRAVQRRREWPTRMIQALQGLIQRRVLAQALDPAKPITIPWYLLTLFKIPLVRDIPARIIGLGIVPVHVRRQAPATRAGIGSS